MDFNTNLFRRPTRSWSTHQLISIYTEVSLRFTSAICSRDKKPQQQQHNLNKTPPATKTCNCRKADECPLNGECLLKEVVYQAKVTTKEKTETCIGLTATEFKTRWRNHQMSFKHENKKNDTELSKYLWQLKEKKKDFTITWKILAKARAYTTLTKRCNLCISEKFFIISKPHMATLNKRNELISTCRHRREYILKYNN